MQKLNALYAEVGDDGEAGGGAAGGGSEESGHGKKPDDVVPKTQFIAALNNQTTKHTAEMAALRAEMEAKIAAATAKPAAVEKVYTRAELNALVEARTITQDQADSQMDLQISRNAEASAARVTTAIVTEAQTKERVDSEIARYTAVAPEILDEAHETRQKIKDAYGYLLSHGDKASVATQLKAIYSVLGPVDKLERSRGGKPAHESHREDGGGGGEGRKPKGGADGLTYDGLDARTKAHYDRLLASGIYKDKAEINAELKFAKPSLRAKYGARA